MSRTWVVFCRFTGFCRLRYSVTYRAF